MTPRTVTIELPALPPKVLQGNGRSAHPVHRAKAVKQFRKVGHNHGIYEYIGDVGYHRDISPPIERAEIQYTFYTTQPERCDDINFLIALKPFVDGLRDAGVLAEDTTNHVTELKPRFVKCKRGEQRTRIEITEVLE